MVDVFQMAIPFPDIHPEIFSLGPFNLFGHEIRLPLRWYALAYIAGLFLGWRYMVYLSKRPALWGREASPYSEPDADDFLVFAMLGVILGGRLGYILFYNTDYLFVNQIEILKVWEGGMSFHGGLIGVILAIWLTARFRKIPLLSLGDAVAAAAPIGLFFGRIANFINGELWGRKTDLPWGVIFPAAPGPEPRHPSQLYECALEGALLFCVLLVATFKFKSLSKPGLNIGIFLVGYALARITLENVREPDSQMPDFPFGLTMGMMLSIPMLIAGVLFIWNALKKSPPPSGAPA